MGSLTFGLRTPRDLFEKLKRDAKLLDEEITSDRFFNFVVTGYSIIDWLKHEASVPLADTNAMYKNQWIKICGDLATASKHFELTKRVPVTSDTESAQGWGRGRWGKGKYGIGEEEITVQLEDGSFLQSFELVERIIKEWESFFCAHGL